MDPRIGILNRGDSKVYYAYANGYMAPPVEGTLKEVEIALGLRIQPRPAPVLRLRTYNVTLTWRTNPVQHETIQVQAKDRADALKQARDWKRDNYGRTRSCELVPCTFRAVAALDS